MAITDRYYAYLNKQVEISPANSDEELQASKTIASLMQAAGLDTNIQEFQTHAADKFITGIVYLVIFAGMLVSGCADAVGAIIGIILVAVGALLLFAPYRGIDLLDKIMPAANSQNVVGFHKGVGPKAKSTKRTFVVLAHYDSSRDELLSIPFIARYKRFIRKYMPIGMIIVLVCAVLDIFLFLPAGLRLAFWIVGLVGSLPILLLGINGVATKLTNLTTAANDNNASIAAMLGVAADVSENATNISFEDLSYEDEDEELEGSIIQMPHAEASKAKRDPNAIRHGKEMLEELAIFPSYTTIEYKDTEIEQENSEPQAAPSGDIAEQARRRIAEQIASARRTDEEFIAQNVEKEIDDILGNTTAVLPDKEGSKSVLSSSEGGVGVATSTGEAIQESVGVITPSEGVKPAPESSGVVTDNVIGVVSEASESVSEDGERKAAFSIPEIAPFDEVPDPFASKQSPGQRAALFDLPDPEQTAVDPLASSFEYSETHTVIANGEVEDDEVQSASDPNNPYAKKGKEEKEANKARREKDRRVERSTKGEKRTTKRTRSSRHHEEEEENLSSWLGVDENYDAKSAGEKISSWDNFDDDDFWKGGATYSDELRGEDGHDDASDELMDAVLGMDTIDLVGHDIYFVATGASELNHAGLRAFIKKHRKDLRGAYLINLDAIGAGELTVFTKERVYKPKSAARRLVKTIDKVARDLHLNMRVAPQAWGSTEATVAMEAQMRAITLMGCEVGETPALVHTKENIPENVDREQIANVNRLVDETIRRL